MTVRWGIVKGFISPGSGELRRLGGEGERKGRRKGIGVFCQTAEEKARVCGPGSGVKVEKGGGAQEKQLHEFSNGRERRAGNGGKRLLGEQVG